MWLATKQCKRRSQPGCERTVSSTVVVDRLVPQLQEKKRRVKGYIVVVVIVIVIVIVIIIIITSSNIDTH